jgi:hypothetical protein
MREVSEPSPSGASSVPGMLQRLSKDVAGESQSQSGRRIILLRKCATCDMILPMAQQVQYICDGCGKVKGEANHWFAALIWDSAFWIRTWADRDKLDSPQHFCGAECVQKRVSEFMGGK